MLTLTEKRTSSAAQAVLRQVEDAYETVFAGASADNLFWVSLELAHLGFRKRCEGKPSPRDIKNAQRLFRDACRAAMSQAKERSK